ncbi:MAG TPA: alpha/beta hydrolase [Acidimicrobiales bacterium]
MRTSSNGIEIEYETFGNAEDPPLLLVMGLGAQLLAWDVEFCESMVDRGFFVIRYDNRDVGLSTKIDVDPPLDVMAEVMKALAGTTPNAPYLLKDMAADGMGLLDALGIARAHIVGASMGGMIVQTMAIDYPERVLSLTSIMSTTGDADVGQPNPEVLPVLLERAPDDREGFIASQVAGSRMISSPEHFDEVRSAEMAGASFDRCYYPEGVGHQLLAIMASGSRSEGLRDLDVNTLVIHGDVDPLITVSGGERTAEVIPGAELMILEGMGHDLPAFYRAVVVEAITALAARSAATA